MKRTVFISHASEDRAWVDRLGAELAKRDWNPGIDRSQVHAEEKWQSRVVRDLEDASIFLLVLSAASVSDDGVEGELAFAEQYSTPVAVVYLGDVKASEAVAPRIADAPSAHFDASPTAAFDPAKLDRLDRSMNRSAGDAKRVDTMNLETLHPDDGVAAVGRTSSIGALGSESAAAVAKAAPDLAEHAEADFFDPVDDAPVKSGPDWVIFAIIGGTIAAAVAMYFMFLG